MPASGEVAINVAQAIRLALYNGNLILQNDTTSPLYTQRELLSWANEASNKIEKALRNNDEDFNLLVRSSTDADFRWDGMNYDPSDFGLTTTARSYTLPPDVLQLRRIRALTVGEENRRFRHVDLSHPDFVSAEQVASTETTSGEVMWDVTGERTLRIQNPPDTALDIELAYVPRSRKLQMYTTGTVTVTQDAATLTGSSTLWVDDEVNSFTEFIGGATGVSTAPKVASQTTGGTWVDPSRFYNWVSAFTTDTAGTLVGNWLTTTLGAGTGYMIASRFPFPPEHAHLVADYVSFKALKKVRSADQVGFQESFDAGLAELVTDTSERQTADPVFVDDFQYD